MAFSLSLPAHSSSLQTSAYPFSSDEQPTARDKQATKSQFACLPKGFQLKDRISDSPNAQTSKQPMTIGDRLVELKARCKRGKLVDGKGKEIRLFKFSCFGNRPDNYKEIAQKESQELANLKKRYTVILIACDRRIN
jgi:hypothetical protein